MDEQDKQELEMLRAFYLCWIGLHEMTTRQVKPDRHVMEVRAQMLVESAHTVTEFRKSRESKVILNG